MSDHSRYFIVGYSVEGHENSVAVERKEERDERSGSAAPAEEPEEKKARFPGVGWMPLSGALCKTYLHVNNPYRDPRL